MDGSPAQTQGHRYLQKSGSCRQPPPVRLDKWDPSTMLRPIEDTTLNWRPEPEKASPVTRSRWVLLLCDYPARPHALSPALALTSLRTAAGI